MLIKNCDIEMLDNILAKYGKQMFASDYDILKDFIKRAKDNKIKNNIRQNAWNKEHKEYHNAMNKLHNAIKRKDTKKIEEIRKNIIKNRTNKKTI